MQKMRLVRGEGLNSNDITIQNDLKSAEIWAKYPCHFGKNYDHECNASDKHMIIYQNIVVLLIKPWGIFAIVLRLEVIDLFSVM